MTHERSTPMSVVGSSTGAGAVAGTTDRGPVAAGPVAGDPVAGNRAVAGSGKTTSIGASSRATPSVNGVALCPVLA